MEQGWGLKYWIEDGGLYFSRPFHRRRAERDARIFIRIIGDIVKENGLTPSWDSEYPFDGKEHDLTGNIKFICKDSPSPDQNTHWKTRIPWNPAYDSFHIEFRGNVPELEKLKDNVLDKYSEHRSSSQYPLIRKCSNDYIQ